jgi:predicted ferric reductase
MTLGNLALITFLALKNTPLAFLTSYSYERLNVLHQAAGYTTVLCGFLHAVIYIVTLAKSANLKELKEEDIIMGEVAVFSMLIIVAVSLLLRKLRYEVFYVVHITMFMLIVIAVGMHRPMVASKVPYVVGFVAGCWGLDRILRSARVSYYFFGNSATVTPLPHGGVRISLRRSSRRAVPGAHAFLWIPSIRAAETHPFTIVSTNPLEMVVKGHDGFTRDLLKHAVENPGAVLRASMEGPYGTLPMYEYYDQVILVAGGSGASFTVGVALSLVRKLTEGSRSPVINFVWVVRDQGMQLCHVLSFLTHSIFLFMSPNEPRRNDILVL